jgi:hypothetical protein
LGRLPRERVERGCGWRFRALRRQQVVNLSIGYVFSPANARIEYRQFKKAEIESVLRRQ